MTSHYTYTRRTQVLVLVVLLVFGTAVFRQVFKSKTRDSDGDHEPHHGLVFRKLLSLSNKFNESASNKSSNISGDRILDPLCNKPSIAEFPRDIFTQKQRRYGALLLHLCLAVYMFVALALVCDDYFVSSLEKICEHLNLSEDVAGATFMAAGSSAPELFTAIISVFITEGDVGIGTIVGSAVFNILVIIAICSLFAGQVVKLSWWPLCRDSFCYMLAIAVLFYSLDDGFITWAESLVMIIMYLTYILLMKVNPKIVAIINQRHRMRKAVTEQSRNFGSNIKSENHVSVTYLDGKVEASGSEKNGCEELEMNERKKMTWKELALMMMLTDRFPPTTRFRAACLIVIHREENREFLQEENTEDLDKVQINIEEKETSQSNVEATKGEEENKEGKQEEEVVLEEEVVDEEEVVEEEGSESIFVQPEGSPIRTIFWILSLPLSILMYLTIPDCRKSKWERWWPATFVLSIFWIMIFSYLMVWMVCVIGYTIGVPDVITGVIFLAAGTSIPDAMSSLLVAREGMGDMAVSNSVGSNIFDILIGLAVPWFIKSAIYNPGTSVQINSRGMMYSVALLFGSVLLTVFSIRCNNWRLDRKLGIMFTVIYFVFITLSSCIEFNLFTYVNFPVCRYDG